LVIGFINHLDVVTTNNYNTVTDFRTTKHSTLLSSVCLPYSSRIYNTGTIKVSLHHTLPISLHCSIPEVFKSHGKSSQPDFLYSSAFLVPIRSELSAHRSRYIAAERTWTYSNTYDVIAIQPVYWRVDRTYRKHSFLYCCVLDRVYRAVAWQRVDQIG
jgi:hypothetical protein